MDDKRPYEEWDQRMSDLPLPDSNESWQKMQQLLKKEKEDDRFFPPFLLRSCAPWGILLLVALASAWLIWHPERLWQHGEESAAAQTKPSADPNQSKGNGPPAPAQDEQKNIIREGDGGQPSGNAAGPQPKSNDNDHRLNSAAPDSSANYLKRGTEVVYSGHLGALADPAGKMHGLQREKKRVANAKAKKEEGIRVTMGIPSVNTKSKDSTAKAQTTDTEEKVEFHTMSPTVSGDSASAGKKATITVQPADIAGTVTDSVKEATATQAVEAPVQKPSLLKKYFLSAGIGEEVQIPFGGQKEVPYSYYGRKSSLSDFIPSIYLRLQREQKWFVQGEVRYGAPQSVKEFSFSRQTKFDTSSVTVTSLILKKTYYHQFPISFNYFILPHWSVGAGAVYSRFYGAVTEQETKRTNIQTQVETISRQIVPIQHFTDSFLYKTQVHVLFQTEYQWKRLTVGIRYTRDLQPYIRYTRPDGEIREERNQSLLLTARFRLWKSRLFHL